LIVSSRRRRRRCSNALSFLTATSNGGAEFIVSFPALSAKMS
jgi:hypothetical protein